MSALRKPIDIKKQPRLGFARTFRITMNGVKYRLFRSAVTMAVITVAIAFLMNSAVEGLIRRSVSRATQARIIEMKMAPRWVTRLTTPGADEAIVASLATKTELLGPEPDAELQSAAATTERLLSFFGDLQYGHRRQMVHNNEGLGIIDFLATEAGRDRLDEALVINKSITFPLTSAELDAYLQNWHRLPAAIEQEREARQAAIAQVTTALGDRKPLQALAEPEFYATVRAAGFTISDADAETVRTQAQAMIDRRALESTMNKMPIKKALADHLDKLPSEISAVLIWDLLGDADEAQVYWTACDESDMTLPYEAGRIVELAELYETEKSLQRAERLSVGFGEGFMGLGERMSWLMLVSLLVCGVGIANAMLMSVTERFREIATLKCLGALDAFIMLMFVLEAGMLGMVGGFLGSILGCLIGMGRMVGLYGSTALTSVSAMDFVTAMLLALGVGLFLAVIAAVYPSFKAARLAPMEAMRIE